MNQEIIRVIIFVLLSAAAYGVFYKKINTLKPVSYWTVQIISLIIFSEIARLIVEKFF